jgi:hypothetical protein
MSTHRACREATVNNNKDIAPALDVDRVPATAFIALIEATNNTITTVLNTAKATLASAGKEEKDKYSNQPIYDTYLMNGKILLANGHSEGGRLETPLPHNQPFGSPHRPFQRLRRAI